MKVDKPWGFEIIWAHTDKYVGKLLHINAGHQLSYQYHQVKEETIYVIKGTLSLEYEDNGVRQTVQLAPGQRFHVPTGMKHRMIATDTDVEVMEASTPELDDVVRLEDAYGREGK